MTNDGGISVGYVGVHAAYQVALAAEEMGRLDRFYCSLLDAPGKWGGLLSTVLGSKRLASRRVPGLPPERVIENPWPFLRSSVRAALRQSRSDEWLRTCDAFDRWMAVQLERSESRVFYGGEVSSEHSFRVAKARGMTCLLDCSHVHPMFLKSILDPDTKPTASKAPFTSFALRKLRTYALADFLVTQSDIQTRSFVESGCPATKIIQNPRGVNLSLFAPAPRPTGAADGSPLKALFAGRVTLLKGIPWLWEAMRNCGAQVNLTLVGPLSADGKALLSQAPSNTSYLPPVSKSALASVYRSHDVLIMPSLIEPFGNVGLEAMACGLPVIVTDHCGTPVPDESWRVPVRNGAAIAERLLRYADDRELLARDQLRAAQFAPTYSQAAFRARIAARFQALLDASASSSTP